MSLSRRIGPLSLAVVGAEGLPPASRRWLDAELGDLPARDRPEGPVLRIRFVDDLVVPRRSRIFPPLAYADDGIAVVDGAGRAALLPLPDPTRREIVVDRRINVYVFEEWVLLPALRLALEACGGWLVRCAGAEIDGRRVAVAAPMRTGKTTLLLELLQRGASYLGDEWLVLDDAGSVHPALAKVTLRDAHDDPTARRWRIQGLRRSVTALAAAAARRSSARWPALAIGLERLAEAGWLLGFRGVPLRMLTPVGVASPGPLTDLAYLCPPSMPAPAGKDVPRLVAGLGELDSRPNATIEAVFAVLHPEAGRDRLFRPTSEVAEAIARATASARTHVIATGNDDWEGFALNSIAGVPM